MVDRPVNEAAKCEYTGDRAIRKKFMKYMWKEFS